MFWLDNLLQRAYDIYASLRFHNAPQVFYYSDTIIQVKTYRTHTNGGWSCQLTFGNIVLNKIDAPIDYWSNLPSKTDAYLMGLSMANHIYTLWLEQLENNDTYMTWDINRDRALLELAVPSEIYAKESPGDLRFTLTADVGQYLTAEQEQALAALKPTPEIPAILTITITPLRPRIFRVEFTGLATGSKTKTMTGEIEEVIIKASDEFVDQIESALESLREAEGNVASIETRKKQKS